MGSFGENLREGLLCDILSDISQTDGYLYKIVCEKEVGEIVKEGLGLDLSKINRKIIKT